MVWIRHDHEAIFDIICLLVRDSNLGNNKFASFLYELT